MPGIEICRAFFFIHTKKEYFRSIVSIKKRNEEYLSHILFAYHIVCLW
mgnify:CR=1 FL=1